MGGKFSRPGRQIEHRRCTGAPDGSIYVIESASGRGSKDVRSVVTRYVAPSVEGEVVYEYSGRLQDGLWVASSGTVYAVCSAGRVHSNRGGSWTRHKISSGALHAIWGIGQAIFAGGEGASIWMLEGATWQRHDIGCFEPGSRMIQIAGTAPDDLYAVAQFHGYDGCSLARFDGKTWEPLEASVQQGRRHKQLMKHGIPRRINSVYCRGRDEVYLCGPFGDLLVGSPERGWHMLAKLRGDHRMYCLGEVDGVIYLCWSKLGRSREFGIKCWDGEALRDVRSDILPWYMSSSEGRLYVTWRASFGTYDGTTWRIHGSPDIDRPTER